MADHRSIDRPPFRRLLIANRGEIAVRVIRACRELGVETVAVYSDADAGARHVRLADRAVRIGPPPAADSYLRVDTIVAAAVDTGAEAVHPGYGFLSEQADFAAACARAGIVFVGPTPATLAALGDKLAARRAAAEAGVPIVPGTFDPLDTDRADAIDGIAAQARSVGWPLLIKAAAGGGGRGMRRVDRSEDLPSAIVSAAAEARASFGDGAVYLERYIEGARHVEVQLLGDAGGAVIAVGERDCSVQRRHQKLVEEGPAPGLSTDQRTTLHDMAARVCTTVGLRNAATAEFLVAPDGRMYFLEVNARLQVEHGVTELVSGIDLVHEQLRLAAGMPLSDAARAAAAEAQDPGRHAVEIRVSAEDPGRDFAPVPGRIGRYREPGGPGVRVDSGVEEGTRVPAEYDPLLAKVMVVGPDRTVALARLRRAIDEFEIGGLQTTLPFHRWLARLPAFVDGELATDLVDRRWRPDTLRAAAAERAARMAATAHRAGSLSASDVGDPRPAVGVAGTASDPWRSAARREATERWP